MKFQIADFRLQIAVWFELLNLNFLNLCHPERSRRVKQFKQNH